MTPERFWDLVDTLGGVADERTCGRLDALLQETGEGEEFTDRVDELVEPLVTGCRWPADIAGSSTMDWVAAAVVAAGRTTYERVLASGEVDPDDWDYGEAEDLLVAGLEETDEPGGGPPADHGEAVAPVGVTLQWFSVPSPERMEVPDDAVPERAIDFGDHPRYGRTPVHDPDWVEAQRRLAADESFLVRRDALGQLGLWLTVRPVPSGDEPAPDPREHSPFDGYRAVREPVAYAVETDEGPGVVLVLPVTDFPASGSRVDAYVAAVGRLLEVAEA